MIVFKQTNTKIKDTPTSLLYSKCSRYYVCSLFTNKQYGISFPLAFSFARGENQICVCTLFLVMITCDNEWQYQMGKGTEIGTRTGSPFSVTQFSISRKQGWVRWCK
jgi:hypothetical protein